MKKIQLLGKISGTRNEVTWPPHLSVVELPDQEAVDLIKSGQARETDEPVTHPDFGRAVLPPPENAAFPSGVSPSTSDAKLKEQADEIESLKRQLAELQNNVPVVAKADEPAKKATK